MPNEELSVPQADAAAHQPNGEQPSVVTSAPAANVSQDGQSREEKARALLKGEPPADAAPDLSNEASIDAHFDLETGEFLEEDPLQAAQAEAAQAEVETPTQEAERDEDEDEQVDKGPKRLRIRRDRLNDRDFAILKLADDKGISFDEAKEQLFGDKPAQREESRAETQTSPTAVQIEAQIEAAKALRRQARAAMQDDRADELSEQIEGLKDKLVESRQAEQTQQQTAAQRYYDTETTTIQRVAELYPDANRKGSKLMQVMNEKHAELRASDPSFFNNPKWPMQLAVEVAADLGIAATPKGAPKAAAPIVPKKVTRPAVSPAPGTATGAPTNAEATLRAELATATANRDVDGIRSVLRKASTLKA